MGREPSEIKLGWCFTLKQYFVEADIGLYPAGQKI
jgi:hypothetical protein